MATNFSRPANLFMKGFALVQSLAVIALSFASLSLAILVPSVAYASTGYTINASYTITGTTVDVSGTASANPYVGKSSDQHVAVDWTGACADSSKTVIDFDSPVTFVGGTGTDHNNGSFTNATWSASHDFGAAGSYSICVRVYHKTFPGSEGSDLATFSATIVIPTTGGLTVIKNVSGGSLLPSAFTMTVTNATSSAVVASDPGSSTGTSYTLPAGNYVVSENSLSGYTGDFTGCGSNGTVTVAVNATSTCTVTNTYTAPTTAILTLQDSVTTDNGGTASATNWTLSATGASSTPTNISGAGGDSSIIGATVNPDTYTLAESAGPSGYTAGTWSCTGGSLAGDQLTLVAGDTATCTITNDDIAPKLTLSKLVQNLYGGLATAAQWVLSAFGPTGFSGSGSVTSTSTFSAGSYTFDESGPSGYHLSDFSCATNGATTTSSMTSPLTLALGDIANCVFTNTDNSPTQGTVTLTKVVEHHWGGSAIPTDFSLWLDNGSATTSIATGVQGAFDAGTYTVGESGPSGYTQTGLTCSVDSGSTTATSSIMVVAGHTYDCTLTNTDLPAQLTANLTIDNTGGGTATTTDFNLGVGDGVSTTTLSSGVEQDMAQGNYSVSASYAGAGSYSVAYAGDCAADGSIALTLDTPAACDITATYVPPTDSDVSVTKTVDNSTPNSGATVMYTLTAHNAGPASTTGLVVTDAFPSNLSYVSDDGSGSYASTTGEWTIGTLANGADATLTITAIVTGVPGDVITNNITSTSTNPDPFLDNNAASTTLTVNTPPVAIDLSGSTNENTAVGGTLSASDVNSDAFTFATSSLPSHGTLSGLDTTTGTFTYTPDSGYVGSDTFTYTAIDVHGATSSPAIVSITVNSTGNGGNGGGGGSGGGGSPGAISPISFGSVLGAATSTGEVLGASCGLYMNQHLRMGSSKNAPDQVTKLQQFLVDQGFGSFTPSGYFGQTTFVAVKKFQTQHADTILTPWHISMPTGLVYLTTLREINLISCPDVSIPLPTLIPWNQNPNAQ